MAQEAFLIYLSPSYPSKMFVKQILFCSGSCDFLSSALECEEKLDKTPEKHLEKERTLNAMQPPQG